MKYVVGDRDMGHKARSWKGSSSQTSKGRVSFGNTFIMDDFVVGSISYSENQGISQSS